MFLTSLFAVVFQSAANQAAIAAIVASLFFVIALVLPTIGITGGIQQLFDGVPDIKLWKITVKGGLWLSWVVGACVSGLAFFVKRVTLDITGDPSTDFTALWMIVSFTANLVYKTVYAPGEMTPEAIVKATAKTK